MTLVSLDEKAANRQWVRSNLAKYLKRQARKKAYTLDRSRRERAKS